MLEKILELLKNKNLSELKEFLADSNNADISECIDEMDSSEDIGVIFRLLDKDDASDVFARLESDGQEKIINILTSQELSAVISEMYVDDAAELVSEMPANLVTKVLQNTDPSKRKIINDILKYPEDSAGSLMTVDYMDLRQNMTVQEAFARIREIGVSKETSSLSLLYVTDEKRYLVGVLSLKELLIAKTDDKIDDIMETNIITIHTHDDKEEVANMFDKYDFLVMPVVDNENRLVGIITIDDAMEVMNEEKEEDFELMAAMLPSDETYFKTSVLEHTRNRAVWLTVLMLTSILTGLIISDFEGALAEVPVLMSFVPMIMDTGGNSGSQASTMIIRGLATDEIETKDVLKAWWKEIRIAFCVGIWLCLIQGVRIMIQYRNPILAFVLCTTLMFTVMLAKSLGCLLPMLAKKIKVDPAIMAAPLITTFVDMGSLMIYFTIATKLLNIGM